MVLVNMLAENNHNVWAMERIKEGWKYGSASVSADILYSRKVRWEENLVNEWRFAKLKSTKSFHPVQIYLARQICQTFLLPKPYRGKFAKVSSCQTFLLYGIA